MRQDDAFRTAFYEQTGKFLGAGLTTILNSLSPEMIILGGGVIEKNPFLAEVAWKEAMEQALPTASGNVKLEIAKLSAVAGVVGSATFAHLRTTADERA
jgi:glucokinase